MKHAWVGVFVIAACGAAAAQQDDAQRRVDRLKRDLKLSDDQAAKALEIYKADKDSQDKLDKDRQDKIRGLLNDDQKKSFDDMMNGGGRSNGGGNGNGNGRGNGNGNGFGGGNMLDRMLGPTADELKKDLTLTDDQFNKIKPVIDDFRKTATDKFEEARKNNFQGYNWREETDNFRKATEETNAKIKEQLTDEQKDKFDKLIQQRNNPFGNRGGNNGANGTGGARGPTVDERVKRAMDTLKIENADEAAAIKDLIKKVCEAQKALEDWDRDQRPKIDETLANKELKDDDLDGKLKEYRTARKEKETAIKDAQKALNEAVSTRQELELIKLNILR